MSLCSSSHLNALYLLSFSLKMTILSTLGKAAFKRTKLDKLANALVLYVSVFNSLVFFHSHSASEAIDCTTLYL